MYKVYARSCESDGKNFYTVPKSLQAKVKAQIEADGYVILDDGTVVLAEYLNDMEVIRECDIFNDDSAEVIEVEEKPKDE